MGTHLEPNNKFGKTLFNLTKKTISPLNSKIWVSSVPNLSITNNAFISDGKIWRQFCFGPRQLIWTSRYQYIVRLMTFKLQPGRDVKNRLHQKLVNREIGSYLYTLEYLTVTYLVFFHEWNVDFQNKLEGFLEFFMHCAINNSSMHSAHHIKHLSR